MLGRAFHGAIITASGGDFVRINFTVTAPYDHRRKDRQSPHRQVAVAYPLLQDEKPRDGRDQRRESAFERRAGEACASRARRRSLEPLAAGNRGRVRGAGAAAAARSGRRGAIAVSRDSRERGAARQASGAAAAGAGVEAASGHASGQARSAAPDAAAARPNVGGTMLPTIEILISLLAVIAAISVLAARLE